MSDERDEYRFYPEDFDDEDEGDRPDREAESAPRVIVGTLGIGAGLALASPFVDPVSVSGTELELTVVAATVFAVGLLAGGGVYARRGNRHLGVVHSVGALGWALFAAGTVLSNSTVLAAGVGVLALSAVALVALAWGAPR